ncbi:PBECR2 nuclease fold domain-containing protein [Paenibacillus gorillae]|uniref:PBECR3 domain-containing polyvalent protein n=1 Tax=Paenibacillus gorillae TaxID=1243662 RepID=UPI0004B12B78|nr:PBECR2 nuclease fold domain-containing protein [Paenibacillus gorillae]
MPEKIGIIKTKEVQHLGLIVPVGTPIFIGEPNREHMREQHPEDYRKYGHYLNEIIAQPDYVAKHPKDGSIQYIKEYGSPEDRVLVAVRMTAKGTFFARTLFVMSKEKWTSYRENEYLFPYI